MFRISSQILDLVCILAYGMKSMKAIVVGSGIVGASVAYHLAEQGAEVTIVTGDSYGGIATRASFAWINAAAGHPKAYFEFRLKAISDWHRLQRELKGFTGWNWNGSLWWEEEMTSLDDKVQELISWGYPLRIISQSDARNQEPGLLKHPSRSIHAELEGTVPADQLTRLLLDRAEQFGAVIRHETVLTLETTGGQIKGVRTSSGIISSDEVIVAAGVASSALLSTVGAKLPMSNSDGLLAHSTPRSMILRGVVLSPTLHMRQTPDGRIVVGRDFLGSSEYFDAENEAKELISYAREMLVDRSLEFEGFTVGTRPVPIDGLPVIGRAPGITGLYITVMHSGITLAPLVGRLGAADILSGIASDGLKDYSPERF